MKKISKRLRKILKENAEFEKKAPYNFCDRWCQRCHHNKQISCQLYLDEFERKITCIAYGKDEDDPQISENVLEAQHRDFEEKLSELADETGIDLDCSDSDEGEIGCEEDFEFEELAGGNDPLEKTARNYSNKAAIFLKEIFNEKTRLNQKQEYDFETISWYHQLLPAKINRALTGFQEQLKEDYISLCDAVAQVEVCKKAIKESIKALRKIKIFFPKQQRQIIELVALLHNVNARLELLLTNI